MTALVVGYSGALMPGPLLTMVVAESARDGARVGPLAIAGHALLELLLLGGLAFGLTQALSEPAVSGAIGAVGGIVMFWMAVGMLKEARRGSASVFSIPAGEQTASRGSAKSGSAGRASWRRHLLQGAVLSFSNPYWSLWWATIGAAYVVSAAAFGIWGVGAFFAGHILADFTWYGAVSAAVAYGRRLFSPAFHRGLVAVCGVFLMALAAYFVQWGFRLLI
ncbi:MAG: LysE family transporter [Thermoleophilia bacterium]